MKRHTLWRSIPFALLAAVGLMAVVLSFSDARAAGESASSRELTEEQAAALDYATAFGVDMAEATRRAKLLEAVRPTVKSIREEASDIIAGVWLEHEPDLSVHLRLTAEPSPVLSSIIDQSPVPIAVSTDAVASLDESVQRLVASYDSLVEAVPELQGSFVDERTGAVVLEVFLDGNAEEVVATKSKAEQAAASLSDRIELPVKVEYTSGRQLQLHTYGGTKVNPSSGDYCTGGFVVEYPPTGAVGLATAGHCENSLTYIPFTTEADYSLSYVSQLLSSRVDAQWHVDSHPEYPEFYANSTTSRRTVTSVTERDDVMVAEPICHRGHTTGYSCGEVETKTFIPTGACPVATCDPVWIKLVPGQLGMLDCLGGDSGGPAFYAFSAYGLATGGVPDGPDPDDDCDYLIVMSQTYLSTDFGLDILVGN